MKKAKTETKQKQTVKTTTETVKPQNLDELEDLVEPKRVPKNLDALFGDTGISRFGTLDEKVFIKNLEELSENKIDIEQYAANHGLRSNGNIKELKRKLLESFQAHVNQYKNLSVIETIPKHVDRELLKKMMADGR